jgi:hypothetical protein
MKHTKARALAREINALLQQQEEVVLDTHDIQAFLSDGENVDSVQAMEIVREMAERHRWSVFVYDYGALVRFTRDHAASVNGFPLKSAA